MNTIELQRQGFLAAIKENPYDQTSRLVYADFLLEQDEPEESDWQRMWTPKRQKAEEYFVQFGKNATEGEGPDITLDQVLRAVKNWLETGEEAILSGLGFGITNAWNDEMEKEFWMHYQNYTGDVLDVGDNACPFTCCGY